MWTQAKCQRGTETALTIHGTGCRSRIMEARCMNENGMVGVASDAGAGGFTVGCAALLFHLAVQYVSLNCGFLDACRTMWP